MTAFQLLWDTDHLLKTDDQYDLILERADEHDDRDWPYAVAQVDRPDAIIFAASFGDIAYTDYPSNDQSWPIMSKQMLQTLLSVGEFKHRALPVSIVDPIVRTQEEYELGAALLEHRLARANHDYVIVHLTEYLDILDEENSVIRRSKALPGVITVLEYALKEPKGGLPPIFRLEAEPTQLFISAQGRAALNSANVRGPRYLSLQGYVDGDGDEIDVPVSQPTISDDGLT